MNAVVISDLHIGSRYSLCEQFVDFIKALPEECAVVLNGDIIDYYHRHLNNQHLQALDILRKESFNRPVIWIPGNHDGRYVLEDPCKIKFRRSYNIGKRLYISHGHAFEDRQFFSQLFVIIFRFLYGLRIWLGAESVHVAFYAKRFPRLYKAFREHVMRKAVKFAIRNGYEAMTCGHTHYPEERMSDGIRYINTGSWTEKPIYYLSVNEKEMRLKKLDEQ